MNTASTFPTLLEAFFMDRLLRQRQVSPHTLASYRDTFRVLLQYAQQHLGKAPSLLTLPDLDTPFLGAFLDHLEQDRKWKHMLIVVTYDEYGGFWDHVPPPKGDRWGPGLRVPAIIVSPFAKRGYVDHTQYDTTSIARFLTHRFNLPTLPGIAARDAALKGNGSKPMSDLTQALSFSSR